MSKDHYVDAKGLQKYNSSLREKANKYRMLLLGIDKLLLKNNQKDALLFTFLPEG